MRGINHHDQPITAYNTTNSSAKDLKQDNRSTYYMAYKMMKDYFTPISVQGLKDASKDYKYFTIMNANMADAWEDADGKAPKGSKDYK